MLDQLPQVALWTPGKRLTREDRKLLMRFAPSLAVPTPRGGAIATTGRQSSDTNGALVGLVYANAQSAAITTANLIATSHPQGIYRVDIIQLITVTGNAVSVVVTIGWTDDAQAETWAPTGFTTTASLGQLNYSSVIHSTGGAALTYAVAIGGAVGAGRYGVAVLVTRLV